jgi:hypothetical protein
MKLKELIEGLMEIRIPGIETKPLLREELLKSFLNHIQFFIQLFENG